MRYQHFLPNGFRDLTRRRWWAMFLMALVATASCGRSGRPAVHPVEGIVRCQGKPAAGALVIFHPQDASEDLQKLRPSATVDAEGRFSLSTYEPFDGAPAGNYRVTVMWPDVREGEERGPDRLGERYSKAAQSPLAATVHEGDNDLEPFEL